ncbi:MAG: hypothetical protein KKC20_05235 [Proteobacteria bacterium]|nr:hypothetical protein [Pseudomonadota bacterium]
MTEIISCTQVPGIMGYIRKPIRANEICSKIRAGLDQVSDGKNESGAE